MGLSDEGTLLCNWKVERGTLTDGRTLRFPESSLTLWQGASEVAVPLSCDPPDLDWHVEVEAGGQTDAGLSWRRVGNTLYLSSRYAGLDTPQATLVLRSWDGFLSDRLEVTVRYVPGDFSRYNWDPPTYWMEFGSISFPDVAEEGAVRFRCGDTDWLVGGSDTVPRMAYDAGSGVRFYFHPAGNRVYLRYEQPGLAPASIRLSRGQQERILSVPPPRTSSFAPVDPVLLETGDRYYNEENGRTYDAVLRLSLCGDDGADLDLSRFAVPEAWLAAKGAEHDAAARYGDVVEAFCEGLDVQSPDSGGIWCTEGASPWYGFYYESAGASRYACCTANNALGVFYFYGLNAGGADRKTLPWRICSDSLTMEERTMTIIAAFPAQRHLGTIVNYQLAPGSLRRLYTPIDFTDGGRYDAPTAGDVSWDVMHARIDPSLPVPSSISFPRSDAYSTGMSVGSERISFDPVSSGSYPSCGAFVLTGTGRNPHSGRVMTGLYTLDVVLYLSVGASVAFMRDPRTLNDYIAVCFVPFCELSDSAHAGYWENLRSIPTDRPVTIGWCANMTCATSTVRRIPTDLRIMWWKPLSGCGELLQIALPEGADVFVRQADGAFQIGIHGTEASVDCVEGLDEVFRIGAKEGFDNADLLFLSAPETDAAAVFADIRFIDAVGGVKIGHDGLPSGAQGGKEQGGRDAGTVFPLCAMV